MNKQITVLALISLVGIGAGGCHSNDRTENRPATPVAEMTHTEQVAADELPADVVKAVHEHVLRPKIINAETTTWKGRMAYKVYVLSGNTVYILKLRPDGYYLDMNVDMH